MQISDADKHRRPRNVRGGGDGLSPGVQHADVGGASVLGGRGEVGVVVRDVVGTHVRDLRPDEGCVRLTGKAGGEE